MDIADFAKRESRFEEAKKYFKLVISTQPFAYQGWLEYAKMEEECGNQDACLDILLKGLKFNPFSDNLFIKALKLEEKNENFGNIREMLKVVKKESQSDIDKTWRILLEGALFEGRCGNQKLARDSFSYLLKKCKNYGPVFVEASKYEERENEIYEAVDICELGLEYNTKYNPLWFQYLRLYEKASDSIKAQKFDKFHYIISDMFQNVSKEFHWKINIELA